MSSSWGDYGVSVSRSAPDITLASSSGDGGKDKRRKAQQPRQLLSCTKCRERKVKCDRTKPCSACCARGHPKECQFVVGEGSDYSPIQQSYELRKLRTENQKLKERLQAAKLSISGEDDEDARSPGGGESRAAARAAHVLQRRFKTADRVDNLYFGTPGIVNIVQDFANMRVGGSSLTHPVPRAAEMYAVAGARYPFPTLWRDTVNMPDGLLNVLPSDGEVYEYLDLFQRRAQSCSFPHVPNEVTKKEVERFLDDRQYNAQMYPDMLALIFATLATGLQMGAFDRAGGEWIAGQMDVVTSQTDVYVAASMEALRMSSFMSQPTLLAVQTLVMIGPYLTNSGRLLDAWTLFGTTIRMAHSIGLHRDPKVLDPTPPLRECMIRQTLWWWMLHMDQQYSVTLGRPLGISGVGDCPPPEQLTTNPTMLRLGEFVDHLTILARQILSADKLTDVAKVDGFTDKLFGLWETMPEALRYNESWARSEVELPEWPLDVMSAVFYCKVLSFCILLNRQRPERAQSSSQFSPPGSMRPPLRSPPGISPNADKIVQTRHSAVLRGRALVIQCSFQTIGCFVFLWRRVPAALICWTMGQQAFNACMILILDAIETGFDHNMWLVEQAYAIFQELADKTVHRLAELAVHRISAGIVRLGNMRKEREQDVQFFGGIPTGQNSPSDPVAMFGMHMQSEAEALTNFDTVMGDTGLFLLEDPGLQTGPPQSFAPLSWTMAGNCSQPPTPKIPAAQVPISSVTAAPFPVMSPPFPQMMTGQTSPFTLGLQPRMYPPRRPTLPTDMRPGQFTAINTNIATPVPSTLHQQPSQQVPQHSFSQLRGPGQSAAGLGPRGIHKSAPLRKSSAR